VKALGCEIIFPNDKAVRNLRRVATILLALAFAVMTHAITRWWTIKEYMIPDATAIEGDPRLFTADHQMLVELFAGMILVLISAYFFGWANRKNSNLPQ
jgi:hypothetical protein